MKFHRSSWIMVLLLANVCIAAFIIFVLIKTSQTQVLKTTDTSYSFSFLPDSISKQINLGSRAFIIYDTGARSIVAGKNDKFRFAPASSAKIMAATIVIQNFPLDKIITATNLNQLGSDNSKMGLFEGEQMTVENLLYGMMLPSGNDAAFVLAQNFPGGVDGFVGKMNEKAAELGLSNTHFYDPDGYDDRNYTTAYDLARLGAYAMKNPVFAKIVGTRYRTEYDITGKIPHHLSNLNVLLGKNGVNGIKTGFTDEAGGVLVTSINSGSKNYVVVVLGSSDRFLDTQNVLENGVSKIHNYSY